MTDNRKKELYETFKKNEEKFIVLLDAGLFDLSEGKAEVNCHNGQIQSISIHKRMYTRRSRNDILPT